MHKLHVLAPEGEDRDDTQALQTDKPVVFAYVPVKQFEQAPTPVESALMVPAEQVEQKLPPPEE